MWQHRPGEDGGRADESTGDAGDESSLDFLLGRYVAGDHHLRPDACDATRDPADPADQ
ncbi:hypothetical protein OH799_15715 [Nocardia sp. NBC_00881]|uniref:hypothetical protein n=1 Tax=Nocardia sp. NBC_00881 TaxID=2975995 RepID=UPI00386BC596|nr:hypothetical protein OH799_15715 [Nocardia sp. NBC_00881]